MDGIKFNKHPIWRNLISELKKNNIERIDSFYKNFFIKNKLLFRKITKSFVIYYSNLFQQKILFSQQSRYSE